MSRVPWLKIARRVTREHGEKFAAEWLETCLDGESAFDALSACKLMTWPGGGMHDPRHGRYHDIEEELLMQVFTAVRSAMAEAFVLAAREVLARERLRQK